MKNVTKLFVLFAMFIVAAAVYSSYASAVNLAIDSVQINNHDISTASGHSNNYQYDRGEKLNIDVCVKATADVKDAQVEAEIFGYRYSNKDSQNKVIDTTDTFDLSSNDTVCHTLNLQIPNYLDQDYYKLRITGADKDGMILEQDYELHIAGVSRSGAVQVKDFTLNPTEIIAGRAFTALVKVRNFGSDSLSDLKLTVEVPELNIQASEYMNDINSDESKTFEELLLRVPDCTKPGTYDVKMTVEFDQYESTETTGTITVDKSDSLCKGAGAVSGGQGLTTVTVPSSQEISQGTSVVYPIMIANAADVATTYTLTVSGASSWASTRIDPSSVIIVPASSSKVAYLYVGANPDAQLGDQLMTLTVDSGAESKQVPLTARITKNASASSTDLKNALEIGLVILVVVLIIIGLIIGFNKLKENKQETEPYY